MRIRVNPGLFFCVVLTMVAIGCRATQPTTAPNVLLEDSKPAPTPIFVEVTRVITVTQEIPVTVEITRLANLRVTAPPTEDLVSAPYEVGSLTGTNGWSTDVEGQGCSMAVMHRLLMTSQHVLEFELLCNRGAPSFNMGYLVGVVPMAEGVAVYTHLNDMFGETCSITFDFSSGDAAKVVQIGTDYACGFGHGVYVTGLYQKIDANLPTIGCLNPEAGCQ